MTTDTVSKQFIDEVWKIAGWKCQCEPCIREKSKIVRNLWKLARHRLIRRSSV